MLFRSSSAIVAKWSGDLLFPDSNIKLWDLLRRLVTLNIYFIWLFYEIIVANLHVMYVVCHPNMKNMINPHMVTFKTKLKNDLSKFCLANSITLTPGTVTVRISKNEFLVHAITDKAGEGLPGDMERRVKNVFEPGDKS